MAVMGINGGGRGEIVAGMGMGMGMVPTVTVTVRVLMSEGLTYLDHYIACRR